MYSWRRVWHTNLLTSIRTKPKNVRSFITQKRSFPRRAVMYIPTADERKLKKIPQLKADTLVLDFEDGVAVNQKETARINITEGLKIGSQSESEIVVRVNGVDSEMLNDDLRALFSTKDNLSNLQALMLPKCEGTEHLKQLDFVVGFYAGDHLQQPLPLHIIIESPIALHSLKNICAFGTTNLDNLKLESVTFGSDDYLASIGGQRTQNAYELIYARQSLVATAKAFGLQAIDVVSIDFKDMSALEAEAMEGARMGFTGKQIIHPAQISIVQRAFSPSAELLDWAQGLVKMFEVHQEMGKGAFVYRGKMIDKPLLLQAENIVKMSKS